MLQKLSSFQNEVQQLRGDFNKHKMCIHKETTSDKSRSMTKKERSSFQQTCNGKDFNATMTNKNVDWKEYT
jgi:hypothetical protein